jgi:group I intron endonuclease
MEWTIYKITCFITQKSYVGMTKMGLNKRWQQHRETARKSKERWVSVIHRAIRLYGEEAFEVVEICKAHSLDDANKLEIEMIKSHGTLQPNGYNIQTGGPGCPGVHTRMSIDVRRKNSERQRGKIISEEAKARMSAAHKGKKLSEAHKANIGAAWRGKKRPEISAAMLSKGAGSRSAPASGFTGVVKCGNSWMARMKIDGKTRYLGQDRTPEGASAIYQVALAKRLAELKGELHQ